MWKAVLLLPAILLGGLAASARAAEPDPAFFETHVRPVLVERCYKCHSSTSAKLKGGLRLDSREGMLKGGDTGPAIVPGKPEESRLVVAIGYKDPDLQMPPKGRLTEEQAAALTTWIKAGAPWPASAAGPAVAAKSTFDLQQRKASHWTWQPIKRQEPPTVNDAAWAERSPIDRFVLAKLEEKGLRPAPPADRRALVRRLYFDLVGLPPKPEEVAAFVDDPSPDALERIVDRLLASPHFGERWARHWLDLVRYAETRGHEFDYDIPSAWHYRDYVIRAFNADVPYDRFVTEHVAGDLMPQPRTDPTGTINESVLGTGFWHLNEWLHSPVDIRGDETDRVNNQIDVFGKAFLGLTVACARCHDHKFDAISQRDYYALAGFLNSSSFREVRFEHQAENREVLRKVRDLDAATRTKVLPAIAAALRPGVDHAAEYLLAARAARGGNPSDAVKTVATGRGLDGDRLAKWVREIDTARKDSSHPLHAWAVLADSGEDAGERLAQTSGALAREVAAREAKTAPPADASVVVDCANLKPGQWIANDLAFGDAPARAGEIVLPTAADGQASVLVRDVTAAHSAALSPKLPGMLRTPEFYISAPKIWYRVRGSGQAFLCVDSHRMLAGPLHGSTRLPLNTKDAWAWVPHDAAGYVGQRAHVEFTPGDKGARLAVAEVVQSETRPTDPDKVGRLAAALLAEPVRSLDELAGRYQRLLSEVVSQFGADELTRAPDPVERANLTNWILDRQPLFGCDCAKADAVPAIFSEYQQARARLIEQVKDSPTALAMLDGNGVDEHVLLRGSHKTPGELVPRRFLEAIAGPDQPRMPDSTSGRLELARRMTDASDPLLPRVMVNRVWHHLLGRGIVASVDDFGVMGQPPSHPELLDFLADQFVRDGWSVKRLIRSIVLSSSYQMASRGDADADRLDPQNVLLHRANLRRLEGEAIRDEILAVSGRLDERLYGPSVEVYLTPFMDGRGRPAQSGPLDGDGRRSIYTKIRRNFLPPMMLAFDMPGPFNCMGRRTVSNVPAQALTLLNDPFVLQQAKRWADRELAAGEMSDRQRIARMYEEAFARPPMEGEAEAAEGFLRQREAPSSGKTRDPAVWADFAHVLVNVKEFIFLN